MTVVAWITSIVIAIKVKDRSAAKSDTAKKRSRHTAKKRSRQLADENGRYRRWHKLFNCAGDFRYLMVQAAIPPKDRGRFRNEIQTLHSASQALYENVSALHLRLSVWFIAYQRAKDAMYGADEEEGLATDAEVSQG
jgi:hypothetical protein